MTAGDDAWDALSTALKAYTPRCSGLILFTADRLSADERAMCASVCARCPVADLCGAYATADKVTAGFWAGHQYTPNGKK